MAYIYIYSCFSYYWNLLSLYILTRKYNFDLIKKEKKEKLEKLNQSQKRALASNIRKENLEEVSEKRGMVPDNQNC